MYICIISTLKLTINQVEFMPGPYCGLPDTVANTRVHPGDQETQVLVITPEELEELCLYLPPDLQDCLQRSLRRTWPPDTLIMSGLMEGNRRNKCCNT